jgi:hypothetical protein
MINDMLRFVSFPESQTPARAVAGKLSRERHAALAKSKRFGCGSNYASRFRVPARVKVGSWGEGRTEQIFFGRRNLWSCFTNQFVAFAANCV